MVAALKIPEVTTVGDFIAWDSPGPYLWQLIDGVPVAMSPPSPRHGAIQSETARLLGNHLAARDTGCVVVTTPGVVPPFRADRNFMVPDLGVICSVEDLTGRTVHHPILLIEILSPSNHAETWRNIWAYMTIPALREILVIRTASIGVEVLRRGTDGSWPDRPVELTGGDVTLDSIGLTLAVQAFYRGVSPA